MKRAFTLIEIVVVLATILILAAILFPILARRREPRHSSCQPNLKQIGLGLAQYTQDYDERFPPIALNAVASSTAPFATPYGWADALQPYIKSTQVFHCPSEIRPISEDGTQPGFTGYWFNTNLDRRPLKLVAYPASTLLCGDGNDGHDGSDARYNRNVLPQTWRDTPGSPARRHLDSAIYLYADGHVKALKPDALKKSPTTGPSFALR